MVTLFDYNGDGEINYNELLALAGPSAVAYAGTRR